MRLKRAMTALLLVLVPGASACSGIEPELTRLLEQTQAAEDQEWHVGPSVEVDSSGPARFAKPLYEAFSTARAMELLTFIDRYYRAPANEGYDEVLNRLDRSLRESGFGSDPRLELAFLQAEAPEPAWTPISGELVLLVDGEEPRVLHAFSKSEDVDRVMLPVHAPSCDFTAEVALHLDELRKGMVFVSAVRASQVVSRARDRGAIGVISASLEPYNEDPSGNQRQLDAVGFTSRLPGEQMPMAQISPRSLQLIEAAAERAARRNSRVRLHFRAEVKVEPRPLRTLVATITGAKHPEEAVVVVSHVQEPGACDNASGVSGLVEGARGLARLLQEQKLDWPERSLVFLWGDEFRQSESWLNSTDKTAVVGISSDMTGQSRETGAIALLERAPDPGAIRVLPPDAHTPWGAGRVRAEELKDHYNGLAVIARCAMVDVTLLESTRWTTAEHPWEGGSDHDKFIQRGIPAVLFWHFTDFTYHTSLDRMAFVDPTEMRRTGATIMSTALAVASARPTDMDRYLATLERERLQRLEAAEQVNDPDMAVLWDEWCLGARQWLRNLCLGIDEEIPAPNK